MLAVQNGYQSTIFQPEAAKQETPNLPRPLDTNSGHLSQSFDFSPNPELTQVFFSKRKSLSTLSENSFDSVRSSDLDCQIKLHAALNPFQTAHRVYDQSGFH